MFYEGCKFCSAPSRKLRFRFQQMEIFHFRAFLDTQERRATTARQERTASQVFLDPTDDQA